METEDKQEHHEVINFINKNKARLEQREWWSWNAIFHRERKDFSSKMIFEKSRDWSEATSYDKPMNNIYKILLISVYMIPKNK